MSRNIIFLVFTLVSLSVCQMNCTYKDPLGNTYDFTNLRNNQMDYTMQTVWGKVWLNFCGSIINTLCGSGVSGCQQWDPNTPAGKAALGKFNTQTYTGEGGLISVTYTNGGGGRSEIINLECDENSGVGQPIFTSVNPPLTYNFQWNTSYACAPNLCTSASTCGQCTANNCKWCLDTSSCISLQKKTCLNFITHSQYCPATVCTQYSASCDECLDQNAQCDWCLDSNSCIDISDAESCGDVYNNPKYCPSSNLIVIN